MADKIYEINFLLTPLIYVTGTFKMIKSYPTWYGCNDMLFSTYLMWSFEVNHYWPDTKHQWALIMAQKDHPSLVSVSKFELLEMARMICSYEYFANTNMEIFFITVDSLWQNVSINHISSQFKFSFHCLAQKLKSHFTPLAGEVCLSKAFLSVVVYSHCLLVSRQQIYVVKLEETVKIHPFDDINHVLQSLSRQKVLKAKFS